MVQGRNLTDKYNAELEQFLQRLKTEINQALPPWPIEENNWQDIDDYVCHLNTFYYQSFDHHFMPAYLQQVEQAIKESLSLSRTQTMVKKDIMAIIRRYAGLYNQVKTISNLLLDSRRHLETSKVIAEREQRMYQLKLKDSLEQLLNSLRWLHNMVTPALPLWNNEAYTSAMDSSVLCREAARVWSMIDSNNLQMLKESDRIYQALHLMVELAADFAATSSLQDGMDILKNLKETYRLLSIRNATLRSWFDDSLKPYVTLNMELMDINLKLGQLADAADAAHALLQWLKPLVTVLKQQQLLLAQGSRVVQPNHWQDISLEILAHLQQRLIESEENMVEFISDLALPLDADDNIFEDFYEILQNDYEYYQSLNCSQDGLFRGNWLDQVCLNLWLIISALQSDRVQQNANRRLCGYYREILEWADKYLTRLNNISSDLERLLAPRNLTRLWKGMDIRIEHVQLKAGNQFPPEYMHLLEKHQVETRISESDLSILQAEGDLFIIRVDELTEEEMPYLVISMKGQN